MTHDAFAERLLDLAYGELSPREARKVEAHAASCDACRAELARIRETRRLMAALPDEPAPEEGERILLAAAREAVERRVPRRRLPPWLFGATLVAASLVAVGAVSYRILALRPGPTHRADTEALLGQSPYAKQAPPAPAEPDAMRSAAAPPAAPAPREEREERAPAGPRPISAERKRDVAAPTERPPRAFAQAPPAETAPPVAAEKAAPPEGAVAGLRSLPADAAEGSRPPPSRVAAPEPPRSAAPSSRAELEAAPGVEREGKAPRGGARAAAEAAQAPEVAVRSRTLAFAAPLGAEVRTFAGCEGESTRRVETDARGRVARYVREGTIAGRRVRIVHAFRPDGALAAVTAQDLDAGEAPLDARALGIAVPERAEEARIDAPPRCGR